jgi:hypothetical protein
MWKDPVYREKCIAQMKLKYKTMRDKVIDLLGGKCAYCGCPERDFLEVNHENGAGREETRTVWKNNQRMFYDAILDGRRKTDDLSLTCKICNTWHYIYVLKDQKPEGCWEIKYIPPSPKYT